MVPKKLTPLKLEDTGNRLLFWDSTYTTPHLKPEFNGNIAYRLRYSRRKERAEKRAIERQTDPLSSFLSCFTTVMVQTATFRLLVQEYVNRK